MKKFALILLYLLSVQSAFADELLIHVIEPRYRINWSSPSQLSLTSGLDSIGDDYAPIGHFAVEIKCSRPNAYGVSHVVTGMERKDKVESRRITLDKKLGLGSLVYPFEGALQGRESSLHEIELAKADNRWNVIKVPTSPERCEEMMNFLEAWIDAGSYRVYGGNKDAMAGEGAGCADFAMSFFKIATNSEIPREWSARMNVPLSLMGDGKDKQVAFTQLLLRGSWAVASEPSLKFEIPDTNKVTDWLRSRKLPHMHEYLYTGHLYPTGVMFGADSDFNQMVEREASYLPATHLVKEFEYSYPATHTATELWNFIKVP